MSSESRHRSQGPRDCKIERLREWPASRRRQSENADDEGGDDNVDEKEEEEEEEEGVAALVSVRVTVAEVGAGAT